MEEAIRNQVSNEALQTIFYENINSSGIGKMFQLEFTGFAFKFTGLTAIHDNPIKYYIVMQPMIEGVRVKTYDRNTDLTILEQCMEILNVYSGSEEFNHYLDIIKNQNSANSS